MPVIMIILAIFSFFIKNPWAFVLLIAALVGIIVIRRIKERKAAEEYRRQQEEKERRERERKRRAEEEYRRFQEQRRIEKQKAEEERKERDQREKAERRRKEREAIRARVEKEKALDARKAHIAEQRRLVTDRMRFDVMARDGFRCVLCGASAKDGVVLHVDHIVPLAKGGLSEMSNLRTLCERCNMGKGARFDPAPQEENQAKESGVTLEEFSNRYAK